MRWKWTHLLFMALAIGLLVLAGCSDDDDDGGPGPGPTTNPLIGTWDALPGSLTPLGVDEMSYFLRADSTYLWYQRAATTELRETGTWRSTADSINFHATAQDTTPVNNNYARWYDLSANEDTLRVRYLYNQLYTVVYVRQ